MSRKFAVRFACYLGLLCSGMASAQISDDRFNLQWPGDERPELPEFAPEILPPGLELPPTPAEPGGKLPPLRRGPRIIVGEFRFVGNTVFSDQELSEIAAPYVARPISAEELEALRTQLSFYYIERGYVNSGVLIPDQKLRDGTLLFQIVEGRLSEIRLEGTGHLAPDYLKRRLALGAGPPLNVNELQERFQLLLQDPLIDKLTGRLGPGVERGDATLDIDVKRARPYALRLAFDNHRPSSTGAENVEVEGLVRNLTGWGDSIGGKLRRSEGATDGSGYASIPISVHDTRLHFTATVSESSVIEEPLDDLDIESETWSVELGIRYPVYRMALQEFALDLTFARRRSKTFLLGRPFPFSPGTKDGRSDVTVLRFTQEWTDRSADQVVALRSTFNKGFKALGATSNKDAPDGRFFAWLGQAQWVRRIGSKGVQVILRADAQLTGDRLLPLEQFSVGGANSVRGYRENELVRDNGIVASIEGRFPLLDLSIPGTQAKSQAYQGKLVLALFADAGSSWNTEGSPDDSREEIYSIGAGLRWNPTRWLDAAIYYGYALKELRDKGDDLQDRGIHFELNLRPF